jgi:hypothetical protein
MVGVTLVERQPSRLSLDERAACRYEYIQSERRCFMNPGRKRWLIRLAVLLILGLIALFWSVGKMERNLTIENRSQQSIAELKITIAGEVKTFQNIKAGDEVSTPCPASDQVLPFTVEGKFADGSLFRFTGQIRESLSFLLLPGGQFQPRPKKWVG